MENLKGIQKLVCTQYANIIYRNAEKRYIDEIFRRKNEKNTNKKD